jgi:hypothetical protein
MKASNPGKFSRAAVASALIAFVLFLSLLAASPALHKLIHADADDADHHCAVTEFIHGQVDTAVVAPLIIGLFALFGGVALLAETFIFPLADYRFSASRAPPA